jgi:hypothetical protein
MKAEELRLGNLVSNMNPRHNDSILIIESIGDNHEVNVFYRKYLLSELEPIPLTEEWLLKFGFKWKGLIAKGRYLTLFTPCGKALVFKDNYFIFSGVTIEIQIKYVHQLQNLYFALTGEELTLKP